MMYDWTKFATDMSGTLKELHAASPDVMNSFSRLARAANAPGGALDTKTKELISVALSVAARCDACVTFHTKAAVNCGATRAEVVEAINMAVFMGAGPAVMYGALALEAFDQHLAKATPPAPAPQEETAKPA